MPRRDLRDYWQEQEILMRARGMTEGEIFLAAQTYWFGVSALLRLFCEQGFDTSTLSLQVIDFLEQTAHICRAASHELDGGFEVENN